MVDGRDSGLQIGGAPVGVEVPGGGLVVPLPLKDPWTSHLQLVNVPYFPTVYFKL